MDFPHFITHVEGKDGSADMKIYLVGADSELVSGQSTRTALIAFYLSRIY